VKRRVSRLRHGVFERTDETSAGERISAGFYNLSIGAVLCWGFLVNWLMVELIPLEAILSIHPVFFFVAYFVLALGGVWVFSRSTNPAVSFLGYNMVVVPFGFVINIVVSAYDPTVVVEAIGITGLVTFLMMAAGSLFPAFFERISRALGLALLIVIIVQLFAVFVFRIDRSIIDWVIALIFCGYIGWDWVRANRIPKTLDNAVDSAAALYIDIVNLFLRVLRILGRRR